MFECGLDYEGLAKLYCVSERGLRELVKSGTSIDMAVSIMLDRNEMVLDHTGKAHESVGAMAQHYGIPISEFYKRRASGISLDKCLTLEMYAPAKCEDHLGNTYNSFAEMAKHYGLNGATVSNRIARGRGLEESLTTPPFELLDKDGLTAADREETQRNKFSWNWKFEGV